MKEMNGAFNVKSLDIVVLVPKHNLQGFTFSHVAGEKSLACFPGWSIGNVKVLAIKGFDQLKY